VGVRVRMEKSSPPSARLISMYSSSSSWYSRVRG